MNAIGEFYIAGGYLWKYCKALIIIWMKKTIDGINIRALFSRNIKRLRNNAKLSQISLAAEADLAHNFINDIENGKKWVSPETIAKLSKALKAEPYEFFLSDSKWDTQMSEIFSTYFDDMEKVQTRMLADLRSHYLADSKKENEQNGRGQKGRKKKKDTQG